MNALRMLLLALVLSLGSLATSATTRAQSHAVVVSERAALRSGPGESFRQLGEAKRDESYRVLSRGPLGHWLEIERSDGTHAFVAGEAVWLVDDATGRDDTRSRLFAPPPLLEADGELAVMLGWLSGAGVLAVRPSYLLAPTCALELNLAASVGSLGRLFLLGVGGVVNVFPSWPVTPFVLAGGGGMHAAPNRDAFAFEAGTRSLLYGGGGLRFGFQKRLIVRVEARGYALFDADRLTAQQEVSGGLSAFF